MGRGAQSEGSGPWAAALQVNADGSTMAKQTSCYGPRAEAAQASAQGWAAIIAWRVEELATRRFFNELGKPYAAKSVASMLR